MDFPNSSDGTRIAAALLFPVRTIRLMRWSLAQARGENVQQLDGAPRVLMHADLSIQHGGASSRPASPISAPPYTNGQTGRECSWWSSAQWMANRLWATCLAGDGPDIAPELQGLPYGVTRLLGKNGDLNMDARTVPWSRRTALIRRS